MRLQALIIFLFPVLALAQTQINTNQIRDQAVTLPKMGTTGSTEGQAITSAGSGITPVWGGPYALRYMNTIVYTANHTLTAIDGNTGKIHMRSTSPLDVEIPSEAMEDLPEGFMVMIVADSAAVTIDDANVQIEPATADLTLDEDQYGVAIKRNSNTWDWFGPVSSSSAHVIEDEGTPVTQRANMNFTGAGVTVSDVGGKTQVDISSGGITNGAGNNVIPKSDGTNLVASSMTQASNGGISTTLDDAGTNTVLYNDDVRTSSGTPATGIGVGDRYTVETSSGNNEIGAVVDVVTTDVTGASEDFDIVFKSMTAGAAATEKFRIKSTGFMEFGSSALSGAFEGKFPISGGFTEWIGNTNSTRLMGFGIDASGIYGGTGGNVNGATYYLYDYQASLYRMGMNASGTFFIGSSSTVGGMSVTQTGQMDVGGNTTQSGRIRVREDTDNGTNYVELVAPSSIASNGSYTLPSAVPTANNQALVSTTAGVMSFASMPYVLDADASDVGNVTTGEDQLYSYTLPASTLSVDEQGLKIRVALSLAANGNTKRIKVKFGAVDIVDPGAGGVSGTIVIDCSVIRTGAATQKCNCSVTALSGTHAVLSDMTETLSGTVVIAVTGEGVATNDIVKESVKVSFEP